MGGSAWLYNTDKIGGLIESLHDNDQTPGLDWSVL